MENIKNNRVKSFIVVGLIYILASMLGVGVYILLKTPFWLSLFIADVVATAFVFLFSLLFKNASVYDPYWSVQPLVIVMAFAFCNKLSAISIVIIIAVILWGIRLTANWCYTFQNLNWQDWRYTMLKEKTGKFYPIINFVGIHFVPTLVVYFCILPVVFVLKYQPDNNIWGFVFIAISYASVILQGVADFQMHKFRKNRTTEKFIRTGLWKYSRHPNYLAEILMWWGVGVSSVFVLGINFWYLIIGAVFNTILFLCVSIPMADKKQSKKEGFIEYKNQTRMLLPMKKFNVKSNKNS